MKRLVLPMDAIGRARRLRREMTPQERILWRALRESLPGAHFRKQVPMGSYIVDFACHSAKLVIEVDGGQHGDARGLAHDEARTHFLESEGYRVLRFWNSDVDRNVTGVVEAIAAALDIEFLGAQTRAAPTQPSPHGGGLFGAC